MIGVTPKRVHITLLATYLLSPLGLQVSPKESSFEKEPTPTRFEAIKFVLALVFGVFSHRYPEP